MTMLTATRKNIAFAMRALSQADVVQLMVSFLFGDFCVQSHVYTVLLSGRMCLGTTARISQ
jgi:hypothetical protein